MNAKTLIPSAAALVLLACNPWDNLPLDGWSWLDEPLWDHDVLAASDGLYVRLPHAGQLVRLNAGAEPVVVDLLGAEPTSMSLGPDLETVVVLQTATSCVTDEPKVDEMAECPEDDRVVDHQLALVRDGALLDGVEPVSIPGHYNRLAFSPWQEGSTTSPVAVAYLDYEGSSIDVEGVLNLTEVLFVDLRSGGTARVSVGFSASNILFTADASKAVVLSRSQVVVVDLTSSDYEVLTTYHLTLDADQEVDPLGAAITPDDHYLLMSVEGSGDLYAMDLDNESINIVDLDAPPSAMAVDGYADRTALVYKSRSQVDILEHDYFDLDSVQLDEPCNAIAETDEGVVVLYNDNASTHDVYRLDVESAELVEYRLANPVNELRLTDDFAYAVALMRPEGSSGSGIDGEYDSRWGMSIIDLYTDDNTDLMLSSEPVGMAFAEDEGGEPFVLLLLEGLDSLVQVSLWDEHVAEIALPAPPTGIGSLPSGQFYITHQSALGLVSFLAPGAEDLDLVSGFAGQGLFTDDSLPEADGSGEEEE
jgi:hypothetical protein